MTERIDHASEAERIIFEDVKYEMAWGEKVAFYTEAQAHAMLAIAEQQRIANIMAYAEQNPKWAMAKANFDNDIRRSLNIGEVGLGL